MATESTCETKIKDAEIKDETALEAQSDNLESPATIAIKSSEQKEQAVAITEDSSTKHDAKNDADTTEPTIKNSERTESTNAGDGDGLTLYTDPETKIVYQWCSKSNQWVPKSSRPDNEEYDWDAENGRWIPKVTETEHYKWDAEQQQWILKQPENADAAQSANFGIDELGQRTYADADGTVFFWDTKKNAWFPKIDDDFMAKYQMSYGFIDNTSASEREKREREEQEAKRKEEELKRMETEARNAMEATSKGTLPTFGKRKVTQEPPKWFELNPEQNTKVYVWNLPTDITLDEFTELMGKCGMIMRDPQTQKYKLKLYAEPDGQLKGDGLCDYIKVESVELALKILDESYYRNHKIRVQRAEFQMRGEYNPSLKPKRKKKDKEKLQKMKEKLFDWRPDKLRGERGKNEKIVIIKNLFTPELFEKEVQLLLDYQNDLRTECAKCGIVRKVVIYDRHPEGVAQVNMSTPEEADVVIAMMQGRFFGKRQLTAEHWDGHTKYRMNETEAEAKERLSKWSQFLETEEEQETEATATATAERIATEHETQNSADLEIPNENSTICQN